ncbi:hypothetical protein EJ03DRAFT_307570 [Teratosphaeria nubilosa]|uniref:Zn(2)-C6 fungal-type domain-containing protein n=1 Tax=Teratosphaeria nubilosa TaxID=161662 RepID=A0A6G1LHI4_9PEZI|nr:hypothetical protein EJ03DRAFT_307570 [Teratosphaeria nubilosa]
MTGGQLAWVLEKPGTPSSGQPKSLYNETGARRRRAHQKSRNGCVHCKQRRIKCDETRPACGQCAERRWSCNYPSEDTPPAKRRKAPPTPPESLSDSVPLSREAKNVQILAFMDRAHIPRQLPGERNPYRPEDALELFEHFETETRYFVGSPVCQSIIQKHGFGLATQARYMMHAILAISAKHLSFLYPDVEKYSIAATLHYTRALQDYSSQLVYDIEHGNASALIATSGLLAKLSFINTPILTADTPLAGNSTPAWIKSTQGIKTVFMTPKLRKDLEAGIMAPVMRAYGTPSTAAGLEVDDTESSEGAYKMKLLRQLCDSGNHTPASPNPYTPVLAKLEPLMLRNPTHDMIDDFMAFIATMEPSFLSLLEQSEARALLILACWCMRISLIDQWWIGPSARIECRRICEHLGGHMDPLVQELLKVPAQFCGYASPAGCGVARSIEPHELGGKGAVSGHGLTIDSHVDTLVEHLHVQYQASTGAAVDAGRE